MYSKLHRTKRSGGAYFVSSEINGSYFGEGGVESPFLSIDCCGIYQYLCRQNSSEHSYG